METIIPLVPALLTGSSDRPGGSDGPPVRPKPLAPLFGLAPCGVLPATSVARGAVRSYRTFSPLPFTRPYGLARGGIFSVPLVRRVAPPGRYPAHCPAGVRTFLSRRWFPSSAPSLRRRSTRGLSPAAIVWFTTTGQVYQAGRLGLGGLALRARWVRQESGVGSRESGVGSRRD